jgi:hypothetical protein
LAGLKSTVDTLKRSMDELEKKQVGGALGTILDPTLEGLQPTVAGLGLLGLNPVVAGLQGTVDTLKKRQTGQLGTILDPTLEGLQPTVAGLGLSVLNPVVAGLQGTVDVLKRDDEEKRAETGNLGIALDPTLVGLRTTVADLGLGVLDPTLGGVQATVDTL